MNKTTKHNADFINAILTGEAGQGSAPAQTAAELELLARKKKAARKTVETTEEDLAVAASAEEAILEIGTLDVPVLENAESAQAAQGNAEEPLRYAQASTGTRSDATGGAEPAAVPATGGTQAAVTAAGAEAGFSSWMPYIGGLVAVGGIAAAVGGGGGGSSNPAAAVANAVTGNVVAGPVVTGNGLTVIIYQADGVTELGRTTLDANGNFTVGVGTYTGVVIAKVIDADGGLDYLDEATNANKDLNADLYAAGTVTGGTVTLNINPLTTVAYLKMGTNPSATTVNDTNTAVANAFGLTNLTGTTVIPTTSAAYNPADGLSNGEKYGAALAALSGTDLNNGGNAQTTINNLAAAGRPGCQPDFAR